MSWILLQEHHNVNDEMIKEPTKLTKSLILSWNNDTSTCAEMDFEEHILWIPIW